MTPQTARYLEDNRRQPQPQGLITARCDWADLIHGIESMISRNKGSMFSSLDAERLEDAAKAMRLKIKADANK